MGFEAEEPKKQFIEFQSITVRHRIQTTPTEIIFSNLVPLSVGPDDHQLETYLRRAQEIIRSSSEYTKLNDSAKRILREAAPSTMNIETDPEVAKLITPEDYLGYDDSGPELDPLWQWCEVNGFFRSKILGQDAECWADRFCEFLAQAATDHSQYHCFLAVDGFCAPEMPIGGARLLAPEKAGAVSLSRLSGFQRYLRQYDPCYPDAGRSSHWEDGGKQFHYLYNSYRHDTAWSDFKDLPFGARSVRKVVFGIESLALEIAAKPWVKFPNAFAVPACEAFAQNCITRISQSVPHRNFWWDVVGDRQAYNQSLREETLSPSHVDGFSSLVNKLVHLIQVLRSGMGTSLELYSEACAVEGPLSFLLLVTVLEQLLIGKDRGEQQEKFSNRFARILTTSDDQRQQLYAIARNLYRCRSDIAHGNKPEVLTDSEALRERAGVSVDQVRAYARHLILIMLFALEAVQQPGNRLHQRLAKQGKKPPSKVGALWEHLSLFPYDDSFWDDFYSAVTNNYAACTDYGAPFC